MEKALKKLKQIIDINERMLKVSSKI